ELRDAVGVRGRCSQRYRSAFGHSAQSEGLETEVVGDRDDVFDTGFQGVVEEVAAGEAAAALVHLDPQNPLRVGVDSEHLQESGLEVEVADPPGNPDERSRQIGKHTSELQSPDHIVCRLLLEKKK